ncbi:MAG: organic hydroperoxide resistance protein [Myxococcales bacterium]|nr:organic hydroperoxide resistance protein [Myxococcales bacterium]
MTPLYVATATATNGRDGRVSTADGTFDLGLSVPKGLGGPGGEGTNPEELFAAGYAACYGSALKLVGGQAKVKTSDIRITAIVTLGKSEEGFGLAVELHGHLPSVPRAQAEELMAKAHQVCPYSRATRNNVEVKLVVAESA